MPGPRYTDWHHTHVLDGDGPAAEPYVAYANKMLGAVVADARINGLQTAQMVRQLDDGATVVAEVRGGIPRVTIAPPGAQPVQQGDRADDFVVWARDTDHVAGIDATHPQQILQVQGGGWLTAFHRATTEGYDTFTGRKGTYAAVFPAGVRFAGNVDWEGRDEQRISWYGPSSRYWYDPHIQPHAQYGKFVFMLGQKLLDVDQYIADSEDDDPFDARHVMGAALVGTTLTVVQAQLPVAPTDPDPAPENSAQISQPWPVGEIPIEICRYTVARHDAVTFRVAPGSRQVLWSGALRNALNPWFFNESATAAVCVALPDNVLAQCIISGPDIALRTPVPSATQQIHTFQLAAPPAVTSTTVSMTAGVGSAAVAVDFVGDELREMIMARAPRDELANVFSLRLGSSTWELAHGLWLGVIDGRPSYRVAARHVMFADLRENVVILLHVERTVRIGATSIEPLAQVEIWRGGALVGSIPLTNDGTSTGLLRTINFLPMHSGGFADVLNAVAPQDLAPAFPLYQLYTLYQQPGNRYRWQGAHGIHAYLAYPRDVRFGYARWNFVGGGYPSPDYQRLDDYSDAGLDGDRVDFDGNYSVLGCTTSGGRTLLSCYAFEYRTGKSLNFVDGNTLGHLTGMTGGNARYHPIWLLGKQPSF